jgi:hypothetical protein
LTGQSDLHPEDDKQHFNASILHFHAFVNVGRKSFCDMPPLTPGHKPRLIHRKAGKDRREQLSRRQAAFGWQAGATFEALHKVAIGKVWISGDFHDCRTVDRGPLSFFDAQPCNFHRVDAVRGAHRTANAAHEPAKLWTALKYG